MTAAEVHKQLQLAFDALAPIFRNLEGDMRTDTAFAIGELTGQISKVKALVGRDIDDAGGVSDEETGTISRQDGA